MFEVKVWKVQEVQVFVGSEEAFSNLQHELLYLIMSKLASSGFDLLSTSCSNRSKLRNGQKSFRPNVRIFCIFCHWPIQHSMKQSQHFFSRMGVGTQAWELECFKRLWSLVRNSLLWIIRLNGCMWQELARVKDETIGLLRQQLEQPAEYAQRSVK